MYFPAHHLSLQEPEEQIKNYVSHFVREVSCICIKINESGCPSSKFHFFQGARTFCPKYQETTCFWSQWQRFKLLITFYLRMNNIGPIWFKSLYYITFFILQIIILWSLPLHSTWFLPSSLLRAQQQWIHLILCTALWGRSYNHPHHLQKRKLRHGHVKLLSQCCALKKRSIQDANWNSPVWFWVLILHQ